jgi:hypothetical protein
VTQAGWDEPVAHFSRMSQTFRDGTPDGDGGRRVCANVAAARGGALVAARKAGQRSFSISDRTEVMWSACVPVAAELPLLLSSRV